MAGVLKHGQQPAPKKFAMTQYGKVRQPD